MEKLLRAIVSIIILVSLENCIYAKADSSFVSRLCQKINSDEGYLERLCWRIFYDSTNEAYNFWEALGTDQAREDFLNRLRRSDEVELRIKAFELYYQPVFRYNYPELFEKQTLVKEFLPGLQCPNKLSAEDCLNISILASSVEKKDVYFDTIQRLSFSLAKLDSELHVDEADKEAFTRRSFEFPLFRSDLGQACLKNLRNRASDEIVQWETQRIIACAVILVGKLKTISSDEEYPAIRSILAKDLSRIRDILVCLRCYGPRAKDAYPALVKLFQANNQCRSRWEKSIAPAPLMDVDPDWLPELPVTMAAVNPSDTIAIASLLPEWFNESHFSAITRFEADDFQLFDDEVLAIAANKSFREKSALLYQSGKMPLSSWLYTNANAPLNTEEYNKIIQEVNRALASGVSIAEIESKNAKPCLSMFFQFQKERQKLSASHLESWLEPIWNTKKDIDFDKLDFLFAFLFSSKSESELSEYLMEHIGCRNANTILSYITQTEENSEHPLRRSLVVEKMKSNSIALLLSKKTKARFLMVIESLSPQEFRL